MILLEGRGSTNGERIEYIPARQGSAGNALTIDALTGWVSRAPALHRALVLDLNDVLVKRLQLPLRPSVAVWNRCLASMAFMWRYRSLPEMKPAAPSVAH